MNTVDFWQLKLILTFTMLMHSGSPSIFATFWAPCFARNLQDCLKNNRILEIWFSAMSPRHLRAARTLATADVKSTSAPQFLLGRYSDIPNISEQLPWKVGNPWPKLPVLISLIHQQSWSVLKLFKSCQYLQFQCSFRPKLSGISWSRAPQPRAPQKWPEGPSIVNRLSWAQIQTQQQAVPASQVTDRNFP